jgi:serine/threonine protein kinase
MGQSYTATRTVAFLLGGNFNQKSIIGQYETIKQLGEGGFGTVYLAKNIITNELVAIKYIDISNCSTLLISE